MLCRNPLVFSDIAEYLCSVSLVKVCQWVTLTQVQSCREGREESVNWVTWFHTDRYSKQSRKPSSTRLDWSSRNE